MGSIETTVPDSIPTVDIGAFLANDASPEAGHVVEAMRHACSEYGFLYLVGHGIPEVDRQKSWTAPDCTLRSQWSKRWTSGLESAWVALFAALSLLPCSFTKRVCSRIQKR
jgi:non-haem dioxygenase in morphine synthesis N-terminal